MRVEKFQRACVALVSVCFLTLGMQTPAAAGIVGTSEAVSAARHQESLSTVQAAMARDDVRAKLTELGVDAAELDGRLAALSDAELAMLAEKIDQAPAGADDLFVVIGIVFVVLLILELTGTIDIFKRA